jgi:hypothetical protein
MGGTIVLEGENDNLIMVKVTNFLRQRVGVLLNDRTDLGTQKEFGGGVKWRGEKLQKRGIGLFGRIPTRFMS